MKTVSSIMLAAALLATSASARIGETVEQIEQRYGRAVSSPNRKLAPVEIRVYRFSGMIIAVSFIDGCSEGEAFSKADESEFTTNEINLLLEANAGGMKWSKSADISVSAKTWSTDGNARSAQYQQFPKKRLHILTAKCITLENEEQKRQDAEKLKGF